MPLPFIQAKGHGSKSKGTRKGPKKGTGKR